MLNRSSKPVRPRNINQLAKLVVDSSTGDDEMPSPPAKNLAAVELGRLGGRKGGKARAEKLSSRRRSQIARKAARARWQNAKT